MIFYYLLLLIYEFKVIMTLISPLYNEYFTSSVNNKDWKVFASTENQMIAPIKNLLPDISVKTVMTKRAKLINISKTLGKLILFPWGLYCVSKYVVLQIVMIPLYPLHSRIIQYAIKFFGGPSFTSHGLGEVRRQLSIHVSDDIILRRVVLEKDNRRYSGLMLSNSKTIDNGQWVIQATGNLEPIETSAEAMYNIYRREKFNLLMINGPCAGGGTGYASPECLGEAQELGLQLLEKGVRAKTIVMAGRSLGAAAMGQAILAHDFTEGVNYYCASMMTFDRVSNIAYKMFKRSMGRLIGKLVCVICKWSGAEMDTVAASRKLSRLNIPEIIIQHTDDVVRREGQRYFGQTLYSPIERNEIQGQDGVIPRTASHAYRIRKMNNLMNKHYVLLPGEGHMSNRPMTYIIPMINNIISPAA